MRFFACYASPNLFFEQDQVMKLCVRLSLLSSCATALAITALIAITAPAFAGDTLARVMQTKTLVGATSDGYPPVAFLDENNELTGFDIEVAKEIAKRLGATFKPVTPSWEAQVAGKWSGRWDIAVGSMTPTAKRAQVLDFPAIYYYTPAVFITHKQSNITKISALNGQKIGACSACAYEDYLNGTLVIDAQNVPEFDFKITKADVTAYESSGLILDDLRLGDGVRLHAALVNLPTATEAIAKGLPFKVLGEPVFYEPLAVAVDKGDPEFSAKIKQIVTQMHQDGTLQKLSQHWFKVDLTQTHAK